MARTKNHRALTPDDIREIEEWLAGLPSTEKALAELRKNPLDLDRDPEFVIDLLKAQFIEDIYAAMEQEGLNRNTLAQRLGKSRQYVSRILNETANFTLESLVAIAIALDRRIALRLLKRDERIDITPFQQRPASVSALEPRKPAKQRRVRKAVAAAVGRKRKTPRRAAP